MPERLVKISEKQIDIWPNKTLYTVFPFCFDLAEECMKAQRRNIPFFLEGGRNPLTYSAGAQYPDMPLKTDTKCEICTLKLNSEITNVVVVAALLSKIYCYRLSQFFSCHVKHFSLKLHLREAGNQDKDLDFCF